jgi:hypothetical protein
MVRVAMGWCVIPAGVHFSSAVLADESGLIALTHLVHSSTYSTIHTMGLLGWCPTMAGDLTTATHYGVIGRVMRAMQDKVLGVLVRNLIACGGCGWQRFRPLVIVLVMQGLRVHQVGSWT